MAHPDLSRFGWTAPPVARVALLALLLPAFAHLPAQFGLAGSRAATIGQWRHPEAQLQALVGDGLDVSLIDGADRLLPPHARIVVITPGRDPRRAERLAFFRSRYWLTPRPVWWLAAAPRDGSWESQSWNPDPLTHASVAAFARQHGVTHALVFGDVPLRDLGRPLIERPTGRLVALVSDSGTPPASPPYGTSWSRAPVAPALAAALLAVVALGLAGRLLAGSPSRPVSWMDSAAGAWWLGSVTLTAGMFWLDRLQVPPGVQRVVLAGIGVGATVAALARRRAGSRGRPRPEPAGPAETGAPDVPAHGLSLPRTIGWLAAALLAVNIAFVAVLAVGQPLEAWDSWSHWAGRARSIVREGGIGPATTGDSTRIQGHLHYPLAVPLREAWVFGWLGAPDDRWVGVLTLLDYLALLALLRGALGRARAPALVPVTLAAAIFPLAAGAGAAMPDVTVALLSTAGVVHLWYWIRSGARADLVLGALAAGALAWFKTEGAILCGVIAAALIATGLPRRRFAAAVATIGAASSAIALPWWLLRPDVPEAVVDFVPLTGNAVVAGLDRLWPIARQVALILVHPLLGFVWPVTALVLAATLADTRGRAESWRRADHLPLFVAIAYAAIMTLPYLLSAYVPLEAHVRNSYFRLAAQVTPLLLFWLGLRARGEPAG